MHFNFAKHLRISSSVSSLSSDHWFCLSLLLAPLSCDIAIQYAQSLNYTHQACNRFQVQFRRQIDTTHFHFGCLNIRVIVSRRQLNAYCGRFGLIHSVIFRYQQNSKNEYESCCEHCEKLHKFHPIRGKSTTWSTHSIFD